ncbi:MAG: serine/threonine protein kinase [Lachnospiraceae bacterium]|nr:serine/threonine protein kinase [Lachnospiraceae bacterium]
MLEVGSIIDGKYKILSEIGRGGMSTVYLAINEKANKPWAVKEVCKDGRQNFEVVRQSLIMEMDLLKKLHHPNLPSISDIIDQDNNFLIVMDYIDGVTLQDILKENGAQSQENVVNWALQLCDVLDYLHTRKPPIIYRDIKPSNIMLKSDGSLVLIDFGTAREFKERNIADTVCLGTQGYAAPEQFGGQGQTDARTDIYELGATMYHLLTGHNPSEPPYEMYPITTWNQALSSGLEKIILKCTQRNPIDRYQSADELRDALEHYKDLEIPVIKRYRRNTLVFFITILLTICTGMSSFAFSLAAKGKQETEYDYLVKMADMTTDKDEMVRYYLQAIDMDSQRAEAYNNLMDRFLENAVFTMEEEKVLLRINASVDKYLQAFNTYDAKGYAQLCFNIGNAYWFYYENEEGRQTNATAWFKAAANVYESMPEMQMEYKRCCIYVEIGNFYKKVVAAQIEGTDIGMYGEYWNNLCKLKEYNDEMPDRDLITLRLYKEIVSRTIEYAKYLKEDGILLEEIEVVFSEISNVMESMKSQATSTVSDEIAKIEELLEVSEQMLASSYKGGA